jgi:hypothetical protein
MPIGISPMTPTNLDRGEDRTLNPKQPRDGKRPEEKQPPRSVKEQALDAIEDAVPPTNAPTR